MFRIVTSPRPNPIDLRPGLDPDLAALVVKAISVDPAQRFPSAESFREHLIGWLDAHGATSSHAPELQRWMKSTPAVERKTTPVAATSAALSVANALDFHAAARDTVGTPMSAASSSNAPKGSRKFALFATAGSVAGLLVLCGTVGGMRLLGRETHAAEREQIPVALVVPRTGEPPGEAESARAQAGAMNIKNALADVTVKATPAAVRLFLDNVPLSGNPSVGQYPRDGQPHIVRAEAAHYITQTALVPFDSESHVVEINLQKVPPPPPPPAPSAVPLPSPLPSASSPRK